MSGAFAVAVAIAVPLGFLYLVHWLDLYASGSFRAVAVCFGWGGVACALAYGVNSALLPLVGMGLLAVLVGPLVEEILKAAVLVVYVRRPAFTYFVDGAIYGFAAGTGFAVLENLLYLGHADAGEGLGVAVSRAFSTSLMHGTTSALIGVALGWARFARPGRRRPGLVAGAGAALVLHALFNSLVTNNTGLPAIAGSLALGLGGVGIIAGFIFLGLREERAWLQTSLGLDVGVSAGESAVVQQMADLDSLLAPIGARFGATKQAQVRSFLQKQAQLGLKHRAADLTTDSDLSAGLTAEVATLRAEVDDLRRAVGVYCMSYVRSILPPDTAPLWSKLQETLATPAAPPTMNLWRNLGQRMADPAPGPEGGDVR